MGIMGGRDSEQEWNHAMSTSVEQDVTRTLHAKPAEYFTQYSYFNGTLATSPTTSSQPNNSLDKTSSPNS